MERRRSRSKSKSNKARSPSPRPRRRERRSEKVLSAKAFYSTYHGHELKHLYIFETRMRRKPKPPMSAGAKQIRDAIWLAGDSSLDNKHWFPEDRGAVVNHMDEVLKEPNSCRRDIAWWINKLVEERGYDNELFAINTSYEEGKIESRARGHLLPQDEYLRDNLLPDDSVIVSVGGNDIALFPQLPCTIINMAILNLCTPQICLDNACGCALPCDDYLYGKMKILSHLLIYILILIHIVIHLNILYNHSVDFIFFLANSTLFSYQRLFIWLSFKLMCMSPRIWIYAASVWNAYPKLCR